MSTDARRAEVEQQLSTLAILQSVYCMEGEFTTPEDTATVLDAFSNGEELPVQSLEVSLQATLNIALQEDVASRMIGLHISWNTDKSAKTKEGTIEKLHLRLRQPEWLSKRNAEQLCSSFQARFAGLPEEEAEDEVAFVALAVEAAKELSLQAASSADQHVDDNQVKSETNPSDSLVYGGTS